MLDYDKKVIEQYEQFDKKELREELAKLQRETIAKGIPVIFMIDGFESTNRGYIINQLVKDLDSRSYDVRVFDDFEDDDYEYIREFWRNIPAYGDFSFFYRSMYFQMFNDLKIKDKKLDKRIKMLENTEKMLYDDNYLILKFFLDIDEKTQKKNIKKIKEDRFKEFLISKPDKEQQKKFDKYHEHMSKVLDMSNFDFAKWNIIPAQDKKTAANMILSIAIGEIRKHLKSVEKSQKDKENFKFKSENKTDFMGEVDLEAKLSDDLYQEIKDDLQDEAGELAYKLYTKKIPTVLVFEGIDAAGKGGAIARLVNEIDPRIYHINPTAAPSGAEKEHHYMWRFMTNLPDKTDIAIFDRSWYGRVMVERVEKFASELEWSRAYNEINNMEEKLIDNGVLLLKYHLVISKDEQESRFKDREEEKPYKITDEDWRNRERWDDYIESMNDMIHYTSTEKAPWKIISSENKKHARVEVLKDFIEKAKKILKEE